jgi:hypothetical protein
MISNAWFTVNYFHVSFGKQDLIQDAIKIVNEIEGIQIDEKQSSVFQKLSSTKNSETKRLLWHFNKNVPHWFLSPWFQSMDKKKINLFECSEVLSSGDFIPSGPSQRVISTDNMEEDADVRLRLACATTWSLKRSKAFCTSSFCINHV